MFLGENQRVPKNQISRPVPPGCHAKELFCHDFLKRGEVASGSSVQQSPAGSRVELHRNPQSLLVVVADLWENYRFIDEYTPLVSKG